MTPDSGKTTVVRPMPQGVMGITRDWLTGVLQASGLEVEVSSVEPTMLGEGVGMMSSLGRLAVCYSRGAGPRSFILKMPSLNETNRAAAVAFHCYEREVQFYQRAASLTAARTPKIYYADLLGEDQFVLLMEDLGDYVVGNQVVGATKKQADLVIGAMSMFHASFWGRIDDLNLEFIPNHYPSYFSENLHHGTVACWDAMVELAGSVLPPVMVEARAAYLPAIPRMQEWMTAAPRTIVGGDFRMDNMYFGRRSEQSAVVVADFQGVLMGKGAHDLAYFLSQSLPIDTRRANEQALVALWQEGLVENGVANYSKEQAWEDYRRSVLGLWTYVTVIAGSLDPSNERGATWMREMVRRSAATIVDLELLDLLAEFS